MDSRIIYWDALKGFAILLVILGHSLLTVSGTDSVLFRVIYSFHVPLFFTISGYFFFFSLQRHKTSEVLLKKAIMLLLPVIIVSTIDWSIYYLDMSLSLKDNLINWISRFERTLWFFLSLFILSLIVLFSEKILHYKAWIAYLLFFVIFLSVPDYAHQEGTKAMLPFFLFGYYVNKRNWKKLYFKRPGLMILISGFIFLACLRFFTYDMTFYNNGVYIFSDKRPAGVLLYYNTMRTLTGLSGVTFILASYHSICSSVRNNPIREWLSNTGRNTAWLYVVSVYVWIALDSLLPEKITIENSFLAVFLLSGSIYLLSWQPSVLINNLWNRIVEKPIYTLQSGVKNDSHSAV